MSRFDDRQSSTYESSDAAGDSLTREWAWQHVEAYVDGSLDPRQQQRMTEQLANDAALRQAVGQARSLLQALHQLPSAKPPPGLWRRLWRLPSAQSQSGWRWAPLAVSGFAVMAIGLLLVMRTPQPEPPLTADQQAAIRDFQVAVNYLQKTADMTTRATSSGIGAGFQRALSTGLSVWATDDFYFDNGE
ncbi:MAG: hypothetical protein Tsb002_32760 [Wenzhouxiangellaceae bacterium]